MSLQIIRPINERFLPLKKAVIQVGFSKKGVFGCEKHCSFCAFNAVNYDLPCIPTDEDILEFMTYIADDGCIQICGAGDPLYHLDENYPTLKHIIDLIHSTGRRIQLITKYIEVVAKEWDKRLSIIDEYVFSSESIDPQLFNLINILTKANKRVRISKIYNLTASKDSIDRDFILKYINYYNKVDDAEKLSITLRLNFNFPQAAINIMCKERKWVKENTVGILCNVYLSTVYVISPLLWRNKVVACYDTHDMIENDMGVKISDYIS